MSLSSGWDKTEEATAVTRILGYSENSSTGGKADNTAIPEVFDDWFQGDNRRGFPMDQSNALGTKTLEEYDKPFPNYRVKTTVEIGFNTDGQTIPDGEYEVQMEEPSRSAPITLEGDPSEPNNPFRAKEQGNPLPDQYDFDGESDTLPSQQKGPKTTHERVNVGGVDGIRGSIIFGGSDKYLTKGKNRGLTLAAVGAAGGIPAVLGTYFASLPAFYTFVDFVFMADGAKVVRVWDASIYPAHALYVGKIRRDKTIFDEGDEWKTDGVSEAFIKFAREAVTPGRTPFDNLLGGDLFGNAAYKNLYMDGYGPTPAMFHYVDGPLVQSATVRDKYSSPLFP